MARQWMKLGLIVAVAGLAGSAMAADVSQMLAQVAQDHTNSVAVFRATMTDEMGSREVLGPAVCISSDPAVFVSLALDARVPASSLKDFRLTPAGQPDKEIKGELLGIDPETNLTFIKAAEPFAWAPVRFARTSGLALGQPVASIGLWPMDTGYQPYVGLGYVASFIRVPERQVFVTGGSLTNVGTPVFNADGLVVGIVGSQRFMNYQVVLQNRPANLGLKAQQTTNFFLPVEEFAHVLESIPASPAQVRRLPWMGVLDFTTISKEQADVMGITQPGIMISNLVPGQPAEKGGIQDRDVILALDGQAVEKLATPDLTTANFQRQLMRFKPGDPITLSIARGQERRDVKLTMDPLPMRPEEAPRYLDPKAGMLLRDKIPMDQYVGLTGAANVPGLVVILMAQDSPAAKGGLQPNDLISGVNNQPVQTIEGYKQIMQSLPAGQPVNLVVRRGNQDMTVTIQLPSQ